eukprot:9380762-Karenia_brevis.AAC.1
MTPTSTQWQSYENVAINTKGFALQPSLAPTIDSITGRTLKKAVVGSTQNTSHTRDMKYYIALGRVRAAHDLLVTEALPRMIFLMVHIHGRLSCSASCKAINQQMQ